jgi:WhiB family redox-sensing transcriptional regulator
VNIETQSKVAIARLHLAAYAPSRTPEPPAWRSGALCAQVDPDLFFPDQGGHPVAAKQICEQCPVKQECLLDALSLPPSLDSYGVRGGTTESERRKLRRGAA